MSSTRITLVERTPHPRDIPLPVPTFDGRAVEKDSPPTVEEQSSVKEKTK